MKNIFKKIVAWKIGLCVRLILWRKKPEVIAITGSAGKTTTKEFLTKLLSIDFDVLATSEGYNTEIGAPLSVFSEKVPRNLYNPLSWLFIIYRCFFKAVFTKNFPDKLVVEIGADMPGDIRYLCSIFKPNIGVILTVLPVHMEQFMNIEEVAKEKAVLAESIGEKGKLFLNFDDTRVRDMAKKTKGDVVFFGLKPNNGYNIVDLRSDIKGLAFQVKYYDKTEKFKARLYGKHQIYPLGAAIAVAAEENISMKDIKDEVAGLASYKGRMNLIEGIKGSILIDDSYNANPESMIEALDFLSDTPGRKIAVLGSMNELGDYEKAGHEKVGMRAGQVADILLTVGDAANKYLAPAATEGKIKKDSILTFPDSEKAGEWLRKKIKEGDIILVKGSQNKVRTEKVVEAVMAEPEKSKDVLVRQSDFWK